MVRHGRNSRLVKHLFQAFSFTYSAHLSRDGYAPFDHTLETGWGGRKPAVVSSGITLVLALAKRTKTPIPLNTSVVFALRTTLCSTALRDETPFHLLFDNPPPLPNFLRSIQPRTCQRHISFRTRYHTQERRASFHWTLILRVLTSPLSSATSLLLDQIVPTHLGQKSRCIPHWRLTCRKIFCLIIMIRSWWNFWSMVGRLIIPPVNRRIPPCAIILLPWLFLITYDTTFRPNCLSERSPVLSRQTRYISL